MPNCKNCQSSKVTSTAIVAVLLSIPFFVLLGCLSTPHPQEPQAPLPLQEPQAPLPLKGLTSSETSETITDPETGELEIKTVKTTKTVTSDTTLSEFTIVDKILETITDAKTGEIKSTSVEETIKVITETDFIPKTTKQTSKTVTRFENGKVVRKFISTSSQSIGH